MKRDVLLERLVENISAIRRPHPVRVAIDGVDAAGKTTLADELGRALEAAGRSVIRASIDGFHNPAAIRRQRSNQGEGYFLDSFDYESLIRNLLEPLGPGGSGRYRRAVFDFRSDSTVDSPLETAPPDAILLLDGVFLLRERLRPYWDYSIFVQADFATTVARATIRDQDLFGDTDAVRRRYEARYVPGQQLYLRTETPHMHASIVIVNDDLANPTIES